jgi:hypothetical protein
VGGCCPGAGAVPAWSWGSSLFFFFLSSLKDRMYR